MAEYPIRTYAENPDAYLAEYTIEDHVRDIDYGTQKLRNLIESFYKDYPGFVTLPTITKNILDNTKVNIGTFIGIDGNKNTIIFDGIPNLIPDDFQLDVKYYIVCKIVLETTNELATNPKQKNKKYYKILKETPSISFTTIEPYKELVLGTVTYIQDIDNNITPNIDYSERSKLLNNIYTLKEGYEELKLIIEETFLKKTRFDKGGNLLYNLTTEEFNTYIVKLGDILALNSDKTLDERFLNKIRLRERLFEEATLPTGEQVYLTIPTKYKSLKISNNSLNIYGEFLFKSNGQIEEIIVSDKIFTTENATFNDVSDTIFISSSSQEENIQVIFKNNFTSDITIQYFVR